VGGTILLMLYADLWLVAIGLVLTGNTVCLCSHFSVQSILVFFVADESRACLDQVLIPIRSFTLLWDHNRSKTGLITIMNLIANLEIIYATACHASLCTAALDCLSVSCQLVTAAAHSPYYIQIRHGEGEVRISKSVAAAAGSVQSVLLAATNC